MHNKHFQVALLTVSLASILILSAGCVSTFEKGVKVAVNSLAGHSLAIESVFLDEEAEVIDFANYLEILSLYIDRRIESVNEIVEIDLIRLLFGLASKDDRYRETVEQASDTTNGRTHYWDVVIGRISADVLAEYLDFCFGISSDYLDAYKSTDYVFPFDYSSYNPETGEFSFLVRNTEWPWGFNPTDDRIVLSKGDTVINVSGDEITVKSVTKDLWKYKAISNSIEYKFTAVTHNGKTYYKLLEAAVYDDDRFANDEVVLTVDNAEYRTNWITVNNNGKVNYYWDWSMSENGYNSWDPSYEAEVYIHLSGVKYNTAYLCVNYYGILDTYIYFIPSGTGSWMSGAEELDVYYKAELDIMREIRDSGLFPYYWRNYQIATMSMKYDYALLRRSKRLNELDGEYLLLNLITGEEIYICDSYTREYLISYMDEGFWWIDDEHLLIFAWLEEATYFEAAYDGEHWKIQEVEEDELIERGIL